MHGKTLMRYAPSIMITFVFLSAYCFLTALHANSWHEHIAIGDEQALALYQKNPNDPVIVEWEKSIQSKLDILTVECYDFTPAFYCYYLTNEVRNDCLPHLYMPICKQYIINPNLK